MLLLGAGPAFGQLPQGENWQQNLRSWMAGLDEADFRVNLRRLSYQDSYFDSNDELYRMWLLTENVGRSLPSPKGLQTDPSHFTLGRIERGGEVYMEIGWGEFIDPLETAWWAGWDYPGNPYRGSRAVKLRALVAAGVDMMMLDQLHASQDWADRSDYLGGSLIRQAYAFLVGRDVMPSGARAAYGQGLRKMFGKLESWGPTGNTGDMDQFALVSMWYVAEALDDDNLRQRARAYAGRVYDQLYREAGYIEHGEGFDGSYQGVTFFFDTWAGLASGNSEIIDNVQQMAKLKGHLSLPEPDGRLFGPSHFATSNDAGPPADQWSFYQRDVATAMLAEEAQYLVFREKMWPPYYTIGVPSAGQMRSEIRAAVTGNMNEGLTSSSGASPGAWSENHWIATTAFFGYTHYKPGTYGKLKAAEGTTKAKTPFERSGEFVRQFGKDFLIAKKDGYGAVIHTGRLSTWGNADNISGFSGGALSAFWTPKTGSVVLGKQKGFQSESPDSWDDWRKWPTHAISGETASGKPFSSARQRTPSADFQTSGQTPQVSVSGALSDGYPAPGGALSGGVNYRRTFEVLSKGVSITSRVENGGSNRISELYEVIPVFLYDGIDRGYGAQTAGKAGVKIELLINGSWRTATTSLQGGVTKVRITRFGGTAYVHFGSQQRVKLSPGEWSSSYQTQAHARNILVDLKGGGGTTNLGNRSISYAISASPDGAGSGTGGGGNDDSGPTAGDSKAPKINLSINPSSTVDSKDEITFKATASDASGIDRIKIFVDGSGVATCADSKTCEKTVGPYNKGDHTYYAKATDKSGNENSSWTSEKTLTVSSSGSAGGGGGGSDSKSVALPEVNIYQKSPAAGNTQQITFVAKANHSKGIKDIGIFVNGQLQKTCRDTRTCSFTGGPYKPGTYYFAQATEKSVNARTSRTAHKNLMISSDRDASRAIPRVRISHSFSSSGNKKRAIFTATVGHPKGVKALRIFVNGKLKKTCRDTKRCVFKGATSYKSGTYYYAKAVSKYSTVKSGRSEFKNLTASSKALPEVRLFQKSPAAGNTQGVTFIAKAKHPNGIREIDMYVNGQRTKTCRNTGTCSFKGGPYQAGTYYYALATEKSSSARTGRSSHKNLMISSKRDAAAALPRVRLHHSLSDNQRHIFRITIGHIIAVNAIKIYVNGQVKKICRDTKVCIFKGSRSYKPGSYYYARALSKSSTAKPGRSEMVNLGSDEKLIASKAFGFNNAPLQDTPDLKQTDTTLTATAQNVLDADGDDVFLNYDWRKDKRSISLLNYSFDIQPDTSGLAIINDYSSYSHDGKLGGDTQTPEWVEHGQQGGAYFFDGKDDLISISSDSSLEAMQTFTIDTWIKPEDWGEGLANIISKPFDESEEADQKSVFSLGLDGSDNKLSLQITVGEGEEITLKSSDELSPADWIHVTGTYDSSELKLYVNGELDNVRHVEKPLVTERMTNLIIGNQSKKSANTTLYKGLVDELRIYDRPLSSLQIMSHYKGRYNGLTLAETENGEHWTVAITPVDAKTEGPAKLSTPVTVSESEKLISQSSKLNVSPNFPNPFNSITEIEYYVPEQTKVEMVIYNILGRKVATLVDEEKSQGTYKASFNPTGLTSGVYFCRIQAAGEVQTQKMMYVK